MVSIPMAAKEEIPPLDVGGDPSLDPSYVPDDANAHHDDDEPLPVPPASPNKKSKKKRDANTLRKAPQAPRRFKSSYIMFFTAKQDETKAELKAEAEAVGKDPSAVTTVTEVSKRSAEKWRNLSAEERAYWEDEAAKDKQRYMREKAAYTGPWQVPWKRAKKDPSAPKRPMSAFLYFSQDRRKKIKAKNPNMKNTEVSQVLGEMWRNASDEEKRPHLEIEEREREKYKVAIAKWKEEMKAKEEAQKKLQEEQQKAFMNMAPQQAAYGAPPPSSPGQVQGDSSQQQGAPPMVMPQGYDPNMMYQQQQPPPYGMPPPNAPYYMYPPPHHGYPVYSYPPAVGPNGQPVILGPNGMPQGAPVAYAPPPQSMPPPGQYPPPYGGPPPQSYDEQDGGGVPAPAPYPYAQYPEPEQMGGHYHHHQQE